jgi:DNA polymerase-3 subunit delta'
MRFEEVIGHREIAAKLRAGAQSGRVAHAQLFNGPEGSGALALALAYARYLHCTQALETDACGTCASCKQYDTLQHPDLHWSFPFFRKDGSDHALSQPFQVAWRERVLQGPYFGQDEWLTSIGADRKQLFISVQEAMELNRKLGLKSFAGGWKILILWLPEAMRVDTANKMLKLIEEPTDRTVMLFVSEQASQLLATIRSRVQQVQVPRLELEEATGGMVRHFGMADEEARGLLHVTDGNIAAALRMRGESGSEEDHRLFVAWMRSCYMRDSVTTVELADDFGKPGREGMKRFLRYALHMVRQCIVGNYGAQSLVRLTEAERQFAQKFAPFIHHGNVLEMQTMLEKAHRDISGNVNGKLVFMDISAQLSILLRKAG